MYIGTCLLLLGKENINIIAFIVPLFANTIVALISYVADHMIEAESDIREVYYKLDWLNAPLYSRKLLMMAKQQPKEITFGVLFSKDFASLERYTIVARRAYDVALILSRFLNKQKSE